MLQTGDIPSYELWKVKKLKFKISNVYAVRFKIFKDWKIRVCDHCRFPLNNYYNLKANILDVFVLEGCTVSFCLMHIDCSEATECVIVFRINCHLL